jgi:hypothetical protein
MTPEEKQMLTDFANKIAQTPAPPRDPEAEDFIRTHIGSRPDALYLMTQTVLIQNMALDHAQQEIEQLKQQRPSGGSFLGGAPGGQPQYHEQPMQPQYQQQPPQYQQQQPQQPQYAPPPPSGGGGSSFLGTAAKTVGGIAAGALAFEGIRSLFHMGGGGGGGFGMPQGSNFLGGGGVVGTPGETVINNYYDNPAQGVDDQTYDDRVDDDVTDDDQNYDDQAVDDSSDDSGNDDSSDGVS